MSTRNVVFLSQNTLCIYVIICIKYIFIVPTIPVERQNVRFSPPDSNSLSCQNILWYGMEPYINIYLNMETWLCLESFPLQPNSLFQIINYCPNSQVSFFFIVATQYVHNVIITFIRRRPNVIRQNNVVFVLGKGIL